MDELQQLTKIQRQYLEALEENEFEKLPGSYYARNFIRQYAKTVDLNPDEMVTIYDGKTPKAPVVVDEVNHSRKALHQKSDETNVVFSRALTDDNFNSRCHTNCGQYSLAVVKR